MQLVKYDAACKALAAAKSVDEVKRIRNQAEAMRAYAKQAKNRKLEVDAAEIRIRAERRLGELIKAQKDSLGLAKGGEHGGRRKKDGSRSAPSNARATLAEAGVDKKLSSRAQKLAAVPKAKFEGMLGEWRERVADETERVTSNLLKAGQIESDREKYLSTIEHGGTTGDLKALAADGKRFAVIYADPPWEFKVYSGKGKQRSAERHYDTQSLASIKAMPISSLAAKDCALFLWCVMPELPGALEVIDAWGFDYKTCGFNWVKQNRSGNGIFTGMGYWTRANAELCLFATRGSPKRIAKNVHQIVMSPVRKHSQKPDEVRQRIERLLSGPYLELFGRDSVDGWTVWGNEICRE